MGCFFAELLPHVILTSVGVWAKDVRRPHVIIMKNIKGDLILKEDTVFNESIKVEGNIKGYYNLKVVGNINCGNIDCRDINCYDIDCMNIDCWNIDCMNINCYDIDCIDIILCGEIKSKGKILARKLIKNRSKLKQKNWAKVKANERRNVK